MLSSYVSFTCVAVEPGLFSANWILSYETPETKPLRPVAGIDRTVSSMHQRVQQTSIMHGMDTLFKHGLLLALPGYGDLGSPLVKKNERGEEKERRGGKKK
jgi:hypothetical protein